MTSFLDRLLGVSPRARVASKATYGDGWLTAYSAGGINLSSLSQEPQAKAAKLLQAYKCGWFNKAERKISTDFAALECTLAPEDEQGDNQEDEVEADLLTPWASLDPIEQFLRLMEKPNLYQTGRQLRQKTMIRLDMAGWCFWYTERDTNGLVAENGIYGISPTRLWPSYNDAGRLIGYVLDKDRPSGPAATFEADEIIPFTYGSADEDLLYGIGVVEAVWQQLPLTDLMARHTADLLTTGGRLAGAMWPKERALDEAEFEDAKRAWRNVASDPNAARRLLIFPEPMEWSQSAATPDDIGIPELAAMNRDDILTAFPISPYQLGVPMPGGLNSAETRKEDRRDYWLGTIHPRVELFEETIQTYLVPRYEEAVGFTLDFEIAEPNLDDAPMLIEKVGALDALVSAGFDEKQAVEAVGLQHIKFVGKPEPVVPVTPEEDVLTSTVNDTTRSDASNTTVTVGKAVKGVEAQRDEAVAREVALAIDRLNAFFTAQENRVIEGWRKLPATKVERAAKSTPDWWDATLENDELTATMRGIYVEVGRDGLQAVSDNLGRVILKGFTANVLADLLEFGGERIKDINERTLEALTLQLAEGTRRGYSINQLVDGVPEEGFGGVRGVKLDNGTPAFDPYRSEMIARTETMLSYNRATVTGYGQFGVRYLLAYDGDKDEVCAARNGNEFTIAEAQDIADHPNGTLVWSPVVDKAYHEADLMRMFLDALKGMNQPTPVYITMPPPPEIVVNPTLEAPVVNVAAAEVNVPATVVNLPSMDPTIVVDMSDLQVDVPPAQVTVNVPKADPLKVEATVKAEMPSEMRITSMPDRVTVRRVKRDKGVITETSEVETDG